MIVISQIQRLFVNVCQPVDADAEAHGRRPSELLLPPYHLKKNRKMKNRIALTPMI